MNSRKYTSLNIGCWNINGLRNIYQDMLFLENVKQYDILCLQETKLSSELPDSILNFHCFYVYRPRETNYPVSGGMVILVKPQVIKGITMLENSSSEVQWLKLDKNYFSLEKDIFLCFAYIAPSNSSYCLRHNLDILSIIEKDVNSLSLRGDVMLCGDTNARIGTQNEFIDNDNAYVQVPQYVSCDNNGKQRKSKDSVCNSRGSELLDMYTAANMLILNGRTFGDSFGNYTCFQYNGNSVVDLCIVSETLYRCILFFQVKFMYLC